MAYLTRPYGWHGYRSHATLADALLNATSANVPHECGECLRDLAADGPYTLLVVPGALPSTDIYVSLFCLGCAPRVVHRTLDSLEEASLA